MQDLTHAERTVLADALYTKAMLVLPMQGDQRPVGEKAVEIATLTGIARKAGKVQPAADRFLGFESVVLAWSAFYECRHYDPETRRCAIYDRRPRMCREYPWYGDPPDPVKALPAECAYRADRGEVVP